MKELVAVSGVFHSVREVSEGEVMHREVKRDTASRRPAGSNRPHTLFVSLQWIRENFQAIAMEQFLIILLNIKVKLDFDEMVFVYPVTPKL